jgi:hypothetical protein
VSNPRKAKGSKAEADVVKWLKVNGFPYADRRIAGAQLDKGDVSGVNGVTIEVKNHIRMDLSAWIKELEVEIKNDNAWTGTVLHKRKGKTNVNEWYCSMPASVWLDLIHRAMNGQSKA